MLEQVLQIVGGQHHKEAHGNSGSSSNSYQVTAEVLKGMISQLGANYFEEDKYNINDGFPVLKWENERYYNYVQSPSNLE